MKYGTRRPAIAMMLLTAPLAACAPMSIRNDVPPCARLIPADWKQDVPAADMPVSAKLADGHDDARPWQAGFNEQTGQLEKANDRSRDKDYIYGECLSMHADELKKADRGFFGRLFGL